jgi:hypothetical protein
MNMAELRAQASQKKTRLHAIAARRSELAPQAINGAAEGPQARAEIRALDAERAELISDLETIEAVLARPEYRDAAFLERLDATAAKRFRRNQAKLVSRLRDEYDVIRSGAHCPVPIERLPRYVAAQLTGEEEALRQWDKRNLLERDVLAANLIEPVSLTIDRLAAKLATYKRHTDELLASVVLPPVPTADQVRVKQVLPPTFDEHFGVPQQIAAPQDDPRVRPPKEERRRMRREAMPPEPQRKGPNPYDDPDARRPGDQRPVRRITERDRPRWAR